MAVEYDDPCFCGQSIVDDPYHGPEYEDCYGDEGSFEDDDECSCGEASVSTPGHGADDCDSWREDDVCEHEVSGWCGYCAADDEDDDTGGWD